MAIRVDDLKNLSPRYKVFVAVGLCLLLVHFYHFFFLRTVLQKKTDLGEVLETLEVQIARRQAVARQIEQHKREIAELKEQLEILLAKLPERKDIPSLLNGLSEAARVEGLDIILFEPVTPIFQEFYSEVPVKMIVRGRYHSMRSFFDSVARSHRIVTVADVSIRGPDVEYRGGPVIVEAECLMKTYMFMNKTVENDGGPL